MSRIAYTFSATTADGEVTTHQFVAPEMTDFADVAARFFTFLSVVYGYDVHPFFALLEPAVIDDTHHDLFADDTHHDE